jgi:hypothetical protein
MANRVADVRVERRNRARLASLRAALALTVAVLGGCGGGGGDHSAKVEDALRSYLNTLDPLQREAFPIGAGPPRVKENSCRKIGKSARLPGVLVRPARPSEHLAFWSCVVRFAHTPFHVRVALKDNGKIVWAMLMPRHVLRPGTATTYEGGP